MHLSCVHAAHAILILRYDDRQVLRYYIILYYIILYYIKHINKSIEIDRIDLIEAIPLYRIYAKSIRLCPYAVPLYLTYAKPIDFFYAIPPHLIYLIYMLCIYLAIPMLYLDLESISSMLYPSIQST